MKKKKIIFISGITCAFLIIFGGIIYNQYTKQPVDLREKYPLILERDYAFHEAGFSFETRISMAPNVAEIQIVKRLKDYTVTVGDAAYGTSKKVTFCQYQAKLVSAIGDSGIVTDSDGTFTLIFAKDFSQSYPALEKGMQAICSIEAAAGVHEGKYIFVDRSFYFVDGQTALAAYEGDDSPASRMCAKEDLVAKIKEIREKR